jgi:hypothetical protein
MLQRFKYLVTKGDVIQNIYYYNAVGLARILNGKVTLDGQIAMIPSLSFLAAGAGEVYDKDVQIQNVVTKGEEPKILEQLPDAHTRVSLKDGGLVRLGFKLP